MKNNFDDSIRKLATSNPTNADFLKLKKDMERMSSDNKRQSIELEGAQRDAGAMRQQVEQNLEKIKELTDLNSSMKLGDK